jgi:glucokinase
MDTMILAADVGGTKTRLGWFHRGADRPAPGEMREYPTVEFATLDEAVQRFLADTGHPRVDAFAAGVAGAVQGTKARLVNAPWVADIEVVRSRLGGCPATLLNDLEAMASAIPVLVPEELAVLQRGVAVSTGNAAVIAAGTGMGQALLHNAHGRFMPSASEGGHADFAARTPREIALLQALTRLHGRVEVERVISGRGLVAIAGFTHGAADLVPVCPAIDDVEDTGRPAAVSRAALGGHCPRCIEAMDLFVEAFGAEAGNLALRSVATAGIYLGGGIAPRILPALEAGPFMDAFRDKAPMGDLVRAVPVSVILNASAGVLGAAVRAAELIQK